MLGTGNYKSYYEKLAAYDHGYVMPELPNGEDKVTTKQKKVNNLVLMDESGSMKEIIAGTNENGTSKRGY